jgi:hypothetical protein
MRLNPAAPIHHGSVSPDFDAKNSRKDGNAKSARGQIGGLQ